MDYKLKFGVLYDLINKTLWEDGGQMFVNKRYIFPELKRPHLLDYVDENGIDRYEPAFTADVSRNVLFPTYLTLGMRDAEGNSYGIQSIQPFTSDFSWKPQNLKLDINGFAPGTKLVSAFFLMVVPNCEFGENGVFVFGDCGLNLNPTAEELVEIAKSSNDSFEKLTGKKAKVAMLSYSTKGSGKGELVDKVVEATRLAKETYPELDLDGELQLDAALVPSIAESKAPGSNVAGHANTLIFPDLNAGNIGYKLTQRLAKAEAYGPLCQGIARPVNDLSRGCSAEDIAGVIAITCVQAQK
jgi:phosphate acetyltransferase